MKIIEYTINSISGENYNIEFTFDDSHKIIETIQLGYFETKNDLELAITKYGLAYISGSINIESKPIKKEISDIVGKKQNLIIEIAESPL